MAVGVLVLVLEFALTVLVIPRLGFKLFVFDPVFHQQPFDTWQWKTGNCSQRAAMVGDLIKQLPQWNQDEIQKQLGVADHTSPDAYFVCTDRNIVELLLGADDLFFYVQYDTHGHVQDQGLTGW